MGKLGWFRGISLVLTLMTVTVIAFALPAGSQQPAARSTITLFDPNKTDWDKLVDQGRKGFSAGDHVLFIENQLDPETCDRRGKIIGHLVISRIIGEENAWFVGDFTLRLPDGKITAYGAARFAEFEVTDKGIFAVTGGTDTYRDASGEVMIQEDVTRCDRKGALITVDIGPQP